MRNFVEIASTILVLVGIYLFLSRPSATVAIIDTIAKNSIQGIKTLQGR